MTSIVLLNDDFRLRDNAAFHDAARRSDVLIPTFILEPEREDGWTTGPARRWWIHQSLHSLDRSLRQSGSRLVVRQGDRLGELRRLISQTGASSVCWNEHFGPYASSALRKALEADHVEVRVSPSRILHDPDQVRTTTDGPYHVFTPFWSRLKEQMGEVSSLPSPDLGGSLAPETWPPSLDIDELGLLEDTVVTDGIAKTWTVGEEAAQERLANFIARDLLDYPSLRDRPDLDRTSRLSPYLASGNISVRQIWTAVEDWVQNGVMRESADAFLRELAWREFSYHLLHHYPETPDEPLKRKFADFEWLDDDDGLRRWQLGKTGYPLVDAGMRQLAETGWMHNRVRMIAASFLTKDLRLPWQSGARWFWRSLVDADLANNTMGWQWSAGTGADAQPFFRIFNPVTQGRKFDPDGGYVRRWIPSLRDMPSRYVHAPWEAPSDVLKEAGVRLGSTYPKPAVDHTRARKEALSAYKAIS